MNDQIKREDQLPEGTPTETYARFAQGVFDVARVIHQELQTIAERVHSLELYDDSQYRFSCARSRSGDSLLPHWRPRNAQDDEQQR